jgi:HK97 family phage prohead protease
LRGSFPYDVTAVLGDGLKERFAKHAFASRVLDPQEDIHLLVGHDYAMPLASKLTGTLQLRDLPDALAFAATITPAIAETTHARDALAMVGARLVLGVSPGFRLARAKGSEEIATDQERAIVRTVRNADLYELSLVTRPAYPEAQIDLRNWTCTSGRARPLAHARWR